jgi:Spy/CpxP family protein refolding chaperone
MTEFFDNHDSAERANTALLESQLPSQGSNRARTWVSAAMGVVIFVAGTICGATAFHSPPPPNALATWGDLLDRVAKRMKRDLDLNEAQQQSIERVVRAHQPKLDHIRDRTIAEMRTELQQVIEDMAAVLTPEQAARFRAAAEERLDFHFPAEGAKTEAVATPK